MRHGSTWYEGAFGERDSTFYFSLVELLHRRLQSLRLEVFDRLETLSILVGLELEEIVSSATCFAVIFIADAL